MALREPVHAQGPSRLAVAREVQEPGNPESIRRLSDPTDHASAGKGPRGALLRAIYRLRPTLPWPAFRRIASQDRFTEDLHPGKVPLPSGTPRANHPSVASFVIASVPNSPLATREEVVQAKAGNGKWDAVMVEPARDARAPRQDAHASSLLGPPATWCTQPESTALPKHSSARPLGCTCSLPDAGRDAACTPCSVECVLISAWQGDPGSRASMTLSPGQPVLRRDSSFMEKWWREEGAGRPAVHSGLRELPPLKFSGARKPDAGCARSPLQACTSSCSPLTPTSPRPLATPVATIGSPKLRRADSTKRRLADTKRVGRILSFHAATGASP